MAEILTAIALWCGMPSNGWSPHYVNKCRAELIKCVEDRRLDSIRDVRAWKCLKKKEI